MPRKPAASKNSKKTAQVGLSETPEPVLVNGIRDTDAAEALAPAGIDNVPGSKPRRSRAKGVSGKNSTGKKTAKSKKSNKVIHPKAPITFRRNILPPMLGILMAFGVLGLLNGQWLVAQYQYHFMKPPSSASYSAEPASTDPNAPAHIYIPNINVSAPVVTNVKTYDVGPVQLALRSGVVQYGSASADPGQKGNIVFIGHSSGQLWAPGSYKFVFTLLDKLKKNDRILVDFKGKRYIYRVNESRVVPPTDLTVLQPSDVPQLTLITCTPVGTSKNRLVVTARQVSPNPSTATAFGSSTDKPSSKLTIPN